MVMTKVYKVTTADGYTRKGQKGETKWIKGKTYAKRRRDSYKPCSNEVYHAFATIDQAREFFFGVGSKAAIYRRRMSSLRPSLRYMSLQLWEAEADVVHNTVTRNGYFTQLEDKVACMSIRLVGKLGPEAWFPKGWKKSLTDTGLPLDRGARADWAHRVKRDRG